VQFVTSLFRVIYFSQHPLLKAKNQLARLLPSQDFPQKEIDNEVQRRGFGIIIQRHKLESELFSYWRKNSFTKLRKKIIFA
jgi:hypothetical protein